MNSFIHLVSTAGPRPQSPRAKRKLLAAGLISLLVLPVLAQQPDSLRHSIASPPVGFQPGGQLGGSVAVEVGVTAAGSQYDDVGATNAGSVKVFDSNTGTLLHLIPNPSPGTDDNFGNSIAMSGTRLVVGAWRGGGSGYGVAYVFDLSSGTPTVPVLTLPNPSPAFDDHFGTSVSISGTLVVVGVPGDDTGAASSGLAYVFNLASPTPTVPAYTLNNPGPAASENFGAAVGISGNRVVVGAYGDSTGASGVGIAYVYDLSSGTPTVPARTLNNPAPTLSDFFGQAVAISGTRVVVGCRMNDTGATNSGSAYVYDMASGTPTVPVATLDNPSPATDDFFGSSVSISGTRVLVGATSDDTGASGAGSSYVYDLASGTPTVPVANLNDPSPVAGDSFGSAVAILGTRVVVGAPGKDIDANATGSAYAYELSGGTPTVPVTTFHHVGPMAGDEFGTAVSMSGSRMVVGAPFEDTGAEDAGSVYAYDLAGGTPTTPTVTLHNPSPTEFADFGKAVAISGSRVVVGVPWDDTGANDSGRAYVYDLTSGTPTVPVLTLNNPGPAANDYFGGSVAISGTLVVVSAPSDDTGASNTGIVYVFDLTSGTPTVPIARLTNPNPGIQDFFGQSVAIAGTKLAVGANLSDIGATNAGRAYLYDLSGGTPTVPTVTLNNPSPADNDNFGCSVAIHGTKVAVGAYQDSAGAAASGSAYIFDLSGATPTVPIATLNNPTPDSGESFGLSIAISGNRVVVGAMQERTIDYGVGAAYVYDLSSGTPTVPVATLNNPSPWRYDYFGKAVAIEGTTAVVGAPDDDTTQADKGSVYVYVPDFTAPADGSLTLAPPFPVAPGSSLSATFADWNDTSLPLTYAVYLDDVLVSPAGPSTARTLTAPAAIGVHTVKGRITDALGNVAETTRTFTVAPPPINTLKHGIPAPLVGAQNGAQLGSGVAVDGALTVVGAPLDDLPGQNVGVVKVFNTVTGALLYVLTPPDPTVAADFGFSVAISGTRIAVGAFLDDTGAFDAGRVYIYDLSSGTPTVPVAILNNPGPQTMDYFGISVAISGTRVVVGDGNDNTGGTDSGSAYIYDLSSATPTVPVTTLTNPGPAANDNFGSTVAIAGTRVVIGAPGDDTGATNTGSAYIYDLNSGTPTVPVITLNNPGPASGDAFGVAVAISGNRVAVGSWTDDTGASNAGSVYLYDVTSGTPTIPMTTLNNPAPAVSDNFGYAVAIAGTRVVVGAYQDDAGATDAGSAYAYDLSSGTPTVPTATLNNPGPATGDWFGLSVSISGTRVVVGAPNDDTGAADAGSAYLYDLSSGTPTVPTGTLNNPGPALEDHFGFSVSVSGTRMVVGAPSENTGAADAGSAYVYDLSSGTPTVPVFTLNNPGPAAQDSFGWSVAISGSRVVVGAYQDDTGATDAGSAYVYDLSSGTPTVPLLTLNNPSPAGQDYFGSAVAIAGTRIVVGAYQDDTGATDAGSAYVYDVSSGTPTVPVATLNNPGPATSDWFGYAVAIAGTRVVVGAYQDDTFASNTGSAYVYDISSGTPTVPVTTLNNPAPIPENNFGFSVAISGTRVAVGAQRDNTGATGSGRAYVFDLASGTPTVPTAILNNPSPAVSDNFGATVAISGTRLLVGSPYDDTGAGNAGSAYMFELSTGTPVVTTLVNPSPAASDNFGFSVALDDITAVIGAPNDDATVMDKGSIYVFSTDTGAPAGGGMTLMPASPVNASSALTVSFTGWTDANAPLYYAVLIDGEMVSPIETTAFRVFDGPATPGPHLLTGRITDTSNNTTEVTQGFTVLTPQETWRLQYFGTTANSGNAADSADPDTDGRANLFEYITGTVPNDASSVFRCRIEAVDGQPAQKRLIFSPRLNNRTYVVKAGPDLQVASFTPLGSFTLSDNGQERTVFDLNATGPKKFYTVEIRYP